MNDVNALWKYEREKLYERVDVPCFHLSRNFPNESMNPSYAKPSHLYSTHPTVHVHTSTHSHQSITILLDTKFLNVLRVLSSCGSGSPFQVNPGTRHFPILFYSDLSLTCLLSVYMIIQIRLRGMLELDISGAFSNICALSFTTDIFHLLRS